ncbi:hypothetical protein LRAMOSA02060 [Lichtheimia ramosa]|uniref:Uncharacterized protein n=1 Tax=Lichtheimia ramosa TaxID=688394 RepID=A0A077WK35_9FUNG|nr:hypothetical protein LRAMOSA02060 [Lichtheimia ramosa]
MSFGIPADLGVVSLALASLYTFVVPELVVQTAALFHSRVSERLKLGFHQLQQLFPAFAVSVYLILANTNIHTWHSRAFILIQTVLLVYLPFSFCWSNDTITLIAYRCVLAWSLIYSLFPHEVSNAFWYMTQLHAPSNGYYYVL